MSTPRRVVAGKNRRKRRRPDLAPRYAVAAASHSTGDGSSATQTLALRETERLEHSAELVREVFTTSTCRCFILKSFSEANFHKSLRFGIWSSTYAHNALLDQVFRSDLTAVRPVLFFFRYLSLLALLSRLQVLTRLSVCDAKAKYEGFFHVEWLLAKDVPNFVFTGIKMSNTPSKKSITSCRDCEEVLFEEANEFLSIFTAFDSRSSAWDDVAHYDQLQEKLERKRGLTPHTAGDGDSTDLNLYLEPLQ
ncbi:hypothetical protein BBJ28_00020382 [Nothophytophthora sp. Chile5]|nr:hypothetical protein BBJ28_00020382 [Nothophytophthora sp. Chile5]